MADRAVRGKLLEELSQLRSRISEIKAELRWQQGPASNGVDPDSGEAITHSFIQPVIDASFDSILVTRIDGMCVGQNITARNSFGYYRKEAVGRNYLEWIAPEDRDLLDRHLESGLAGSVEVLGLRKDGLTFPCEVQGMLSEYEGDRLWIIQLRDISRYKATERALRHSEEHYGNLLKYMGEGCATVDSNEYFVFANPAAERIFGVPPGQLVGRNIGDFISPDGLQQIQGMTEVRRRGISSTYELEIVRPDGEKRQLVISGSPTRDSDGQFRGGIGIIRDVTEQKKAEQNLRQSEERLRAIHDSAMAGIIQLDRRGIILHANRRWTEMTGYPMSELIGKSIKEITYEEDRHLDRQIVEAIYIEKTGKFSMEKRYVRRDGTIFWAEVHVTPLFSSGETVVSAMAIITDITERKRIEERLRQSQKLEAIGTLAGGIAHDFNNILFAITGNAEIAGEALPKDSKVHENVREIINASQRATGLIKQLLAFSRPVNDGRHPVNTVTVLKDVLKKISGNLPPSIKIKPVVHNSHAFVEADVAELHQIILNLCTNAIQSMQRQGGLLTATLDTIDVNHRFLTEHGTLVSMECVRLEIRDTGHGIDPDVIDHIYEPFYTTREIGQGTGMGLAVVHGLVTTLGGTITVDSKPGEGTSFKVYFPRTSMPDKDSQASTEGGPYGSEHVMVVDDEPQLVDVLQSILENNGYRVSAYTSSRVALKAFIRTPHEYDLVITDQRMPGLTGGELVQEVRRARPAMPVILITGYSNTLTREEIEKAGVSAYLMKPIAKHDLISAVRIVLDKAR